MQDFYDNSLSTDYFQLEDVEGDNACFYRAMSNGLAFIHKNTDLSNIIEGKHLGLYKNISEFYQSEEWGYNGNQQEELARSLQEIALNWVKKNSNKEAPIHNGETRIKIKDLVLLVHGITYDEYIQSYQTFAGDVSIDPESGEVDLYAIDRWGGFLEQIALSEYFKVPIIVLTSQKFDTRLNKVIQGRLTQNKPIKGVRYRIYLTSGLQYMSREKATLFLLWKKTKFGEHYMALYPKNLDFTDDLKKLLNMCD